MIKRTLYFGHAAYLSLRNQQLLVRMTNIDTVPHTQSSPEVTTTVPIEDIGIVLLDHPQITVTQGAMAALLDNNAALVTCNKSHLPTGLLLPLDGNSTQSERYRCQIDASLPLKKQLWQQTVIQKISNQAAVLKEARGAEVHNMEVWSRQVRSGDADNLEGRAAAYYWPQLFGSGWTRGQEGPWPNTLLNYGYAIVRAIVARALVSSGLLPTLGIHHHNRYNAYCLADDVMEPYRPYVDRLVVDLYRQHPNATELSTELKRQLLSLPVADVVIGGQRSPLMVAVSTTTASLYRCFVGESRKIVYPVIA